MNDDKIKQLLEEKYKLFRQGGKGIKEFRHLEDIFHKRTSGRYVADFILGANDGIITTFVVVAGAIGAALSPLVVMVLGIANLLGDGASMGFGNYLGQKSEADYNRGQRQKEYWETDKFPEVEEQEIREIFGKWGFKDKDLERAVEIVISNKKIWVDIMMTEELGIIEESSSKPAKSGLVTFVAFVIAGAIPLIPFLIPVFAQVTGLLSLIFSAIALFIVGALRSHISPQNWLRGGMEMLLVGGIAAGLAYFSGLVVNHFLKI